MSKFIGMGISRRSLLGGYACATFFGQAAQSASQMDALNQSLAELAQNPPASQTRADPTSSDHNFSYENGSSATGISPATRVRKKSFRDIGDIARKMIVAAEVTNEARYMLKYQHPIWPSGSSGVTIGFGYDLGYVNSSDFQSDWLSFADEGDVAKLLPACGVKGNSAQAILPKFTSVTINFDDARKQFLGQTLPYYVAETESAFQNTGLLKNNSFGALVDLVYNRGSASTQDPNDSLDRRLEIRTIKELMAAKQFSMIPEQLRKMKRIWIGDPKQLGNVIRRETEALLFESGLA